MVLDMITIFSAILSNPDKALSREWLVTNGIGGYASSTVIGANTRRYHGLLVASFPPPLERQVLLSKVDEEITIGGETYLLGANEFQDGVIYPEGHLLLAKFRLQHGIPTFEYRIGDASLTKQVWMEHGSDTVYVRYHLTGLDAILRIRPFCAFRGYHHLNGRQEFVSVQRNNILIVESSLAPYSLKMAVSQGSFELQDDWYRSFHYRAERERGFDCEEDLYTPGVFAARLKSGESLGLVATSERKMPDTDFQAALNRELARKKTIIGKERSSFRKQLLLAADQFVTHHSSPISILAGYPWFTDWGRDTMVALPGLLLQASRYAEAREILLRYAELADGGMIPNRFTDEGAVEYNTADATLWFFHALDSYIKASGDREIIERLLPRLVEIMDWHLRGTRFGIHADTDGLLFAGRDGSQLTWMDACIGGCPVTPRIGKPVEINALWYNALCLMSDWAGAYGHTANLCKSSFRRKFVSKAGYLYDVIEGPTGNDSSIRPNQIMAVSLPYSPLTPKQQKSVVDVVQAKLLTPYGLRTLSPDDPSYCGRYQGRPEERDRTYHQGTAWPWLLGQFADAHYRVYRDKAYIARLLIPFRKHIRQASIGSISEIFDGDPPHSPGGCIAQAWSVAEILRISTWLMVDG
jgi:predicted glycogen debranching enzyme